MAQNNGKKPSRAKQVALGGVFSALSILFMLMGNIIPIATFTGPVLAGICLLPLAIELGNKTAFVAYVAVSILSSLLVADREMVLFFILLFGYYPLLYPVLFKIRSKFINYLAKFAMFNCAIAVTYVILLFLFTSPLLAQEFAGSPSWFWGVMLVVANLFFFVYDILVGRLRPLYSQYFRRRFFR